MSITALVRTAAERYGTAVAVEDSAGSRTFADLSDRVHLLAAGLLLAGVPPKARIVCLLPNSVSAVEVDLALAVGGFVRVSLNPRVGPTDWMRVIQDCEPQALIVDSRIGGAAELADEADLPLVIGADRPVHGGSTLEEIIAAAPASVDPQPPDVESLCALHYSSGTTGIPKGAQRTHANRLASLRAMRDHVLAETFDSDEPAVFLHAGPIIHTSGLFVLPFLDAGGRQVLLDHATAADLVDAVSTHQATHTAVVPTVISRLLEFDDAHLAVMRRMRMLAYAGAPMPAEHIRQAFHRITPNLVQYYGMVEAIPPLTVLTPEDHRRGVLDGVDILTSIGRPCAQTRIEIRENNRPVADGVVGELVINGPAVSPGYHDAYGRKDLGKNHIDGDLHSGDLGFRGADGYIRLTGRSNDMIISGGYNVYPREVEEALATIPGVGDVVVVGLPDPIWGQRIAAVYTGVDGRPVGEATVLAESRRRLPDFKRPKSAHLVDALPLTALGKVDRAAATRMLASAVAAETLRPEMSIPAPTHPPPT